MYNTFATNAWMAQLFFFANTSERLLEIFLVYESFFFLFPFIHMAILFAYFFCAKISFPFCVQVMNKAYLVAKNIPMVFGQNDFELQLLILELSLE